MQPPAGSPEPEPEPPIIALAGPEWTPPAHMGAITALAISHGNIFVSFASGKLIRLGLGTGEYEELETQKAHATAIFADAHSAVAMLATLSTAESVYFYKGRGRIIGKLKGIAVTAVAWVRPSAEEAPPRAKEQKSSDTREVLLGSAAGVIYEAHIEPQVGARGHTGPAPPPEPGPAARARPHPDSEPEPGPRPAPRGRPPPAAH